MINCFACVILVAAILLNGPMVNYSNGQGENLSYEDAQALLDAGTGAFDSGNYERARDQLKSFIKKYPKNPNAPMAKYLAGISAYSLGDYEDTIKLLEKTNDFPKEVLMSAVFHFGAAAYFTGDYAKAIAAFQKCSAKPKAPKEGESPEASKSEEIRPYALFYLGRAYMEQGGKLEAAAKDGDSKPAKKSWSDGIAAITTLIDDYPQDGLIPDALMSRATMHVFNAAYALAESDLIKLKETPGSETMAEEADYLLGYVLSQQALDLLGNFKETEALAMTARARETYQRLIQSDNLVIANEAAFQLANLDFADKKYEEALKAYRSLRSKAQLIASQEDRLSDIRSQMSSSAGDPVRIGRLNRALKREEQKLNAVRANPELSKEALLKIGEVFTQLREFDKARIAFRHAKKFGDPDQQKRATVQIILSHAAQGNIPEAEALFEEFRREAPKDPMAQNIKFLLGNAFLQQQRYDEAIEAFDESLKNFPDSPTAAQIPKLKAQAFMGKGLKEEAIKSFRDFISGAEKGTIKVPPQVIEDTKRLLAFALYGEKQVDEAMKILKDLAANATSASIKEESAFQVANLTAQTGDVAAAIPLLKDFSQSYPESANAPKALYQSAVMQEQSGDIEAARTSYRAVIDTFPKDAMALFAYDRLWRSYGDDMEKVIAAQEELIAAHPTSERSMAALFDRAKKLEKNNDLEGALAAYQRVMEMFQAAGEEARTPRTEQFASYAMVSSGLVQQKLAGKLGPFASLDDAGKAAWKERVNTAKSLFISAVKEFPGGKAQSMSLRKLVDLLLNEVANEVQPLDQAVLQMSTLAGEVSGPSVKLQVMIAQAGMLKEIGQRGQALRIYDEAFKNVSDPSILAWQDLDAYGVLLLEEKQWQNALEIYQKLAAMSDDKQPHAQAAATYGQGAALQGLGRNEEATKFFTTLQEKFPWSPQIMQANFAKALALFETGDFQASIDALKEVIKNSRTSNEVKAKSMITVARALDAMGDAKLTTPETKQEGKEDIDIYDLACNYLAKVEVFYADALPNFSSEALYRAVVIRRKQGKTAEASEMVQRLLADYSTTEWGQKARKEL